MSASAAGGPRWRSLRFAFAYFALFSVFGVFTPYLQKLLALQGFDEKRIGFLLATAESVGIVAPLLWGFLSDRTARSRTLLAFCVSGTLLSILGLSRVADFAGAAALACALGFFYRPIIPLTDGLVLRHIHDFGGDYGKMRTAGSAAFILTIVVLEQVGVAGPSAKAVIVGGFVVTSLLHLTTLGLLPPSKPSSGACDRPRFEFSLLFSAPFAVLITLAFLSRVAMTGHYSFFTLFLQRELRFPEAGYLWIIGPVSEIPVIFFSGALIRALGAKTVFALGVGAAAVRLFGYALAPSIWWIAALQVLHAFTFGAFYTAAIHYVHHLVPRHMKQSAMALFGSLSFGLAAIVGSAFGGMLIRYSGYRTMFAVYGAVALAALMGLVLFLPREPRSD